MKLTCIFYLCGLIAGCLAAASSSSVATSRAAITSCRRYYLKNGRTRYRQRGRFVKFTCNLGYSLLGDKFSTCYMGKWELDKEPICVKNVCKTFDKTPNNLLIYPTHNGAVLNFICRSGYSLNGNNQAYCDGKQWQNNVPLCLPSNTKPPLTCDFENEDICGWQHDLNHDFDWRRLNYETPSGTIGTGPSFDHTKGRGKDGYYMYIESSSRNENDTARLISPVYEKTTENTCFEFYYHMYGASTGTLKVYLKKVTENWNLLQSRVIFNLSGNQGNRWYKSFNSLGPINQDYQIIIEGIRGRSYVSDIAIDDVRIIENCTPEEDISTTTEYPESTEIIIIETCENRCGQNSTTSVEINKITCDCDDSCMENNRCCPDYIDHCLLETTSEEPTTIDMPNEIFSGYDDKTTQQQLHNYSVTKTTTTTAKPVTISAVTKVTIATKIKKVTTKIVPVVLTSKIPTTTVLPLKKPKVILQLTTARIIYPLKITTKKPITLTKKYITKATTKISITYPRKPNISRPIYSIPKINKESDFGYVPENPHQDEDIFVRDDYTEEIENEIKGPFNHHFSEKKSLSVEKSPNHSNTVFIVSGVAVISCILIIVGIVGSRCGWYNCQRMRLRNNSSDSQSDVRFLTNDEILDFTLSRDYDEL